MQIPGLHMLTCTWRMHQQQTQPRLALKEATTSQVCILWAAHAELYIKTTCRLLLSRVCLTRRVGIVLGQHSQLDALVPLQARDLFLDAGHLRAWLTVPLLLLDYL